MVAGRAAKVVSLWQQCGLAASVVPRVFVLLVDGCAARTDVQLLQRRGRELCSMLCGTFYLLLKVLSVAGQV